MAHKDVQPVRITSAGRSRRDAIAARQRRYLISMGIRTLCFVGAVVVALTTGPGVLMWLLVGASFVLPYVAVVMANAGYTSNDPGPEPFDPSSSRRELGPGGKEI